MPHAASRKPNYSQKTETGKKEYNTWISTEENSLERQLLQGLD